MAAASLEGLVLGKCVPCEGGVKPISLAKAKKLLKLLPGGWAFGRAEEGARQLQKTFKFKNFVHAIAFVNKTAMVAEEQGHHPNIFLFGWNKVRIELYTHAIGGLHDNDFIMAAKIDRLA